jgi:glycosyltransferase involved in cell wall biosynthesis
MSNRILFVYINRFKSYPIIYEYCVGLQKLGLEVHYIGLADVDEQFVSEESIKVIHFNKDSIGSKWKFALKVKHAIKDIRPDLVHIFHFRWCFFIPLVSFFSPKFLLDVRTVHVANAAGQYTATAPLKNLVTWFESQFFRYAFALSPAIRKILTPAYKKIPVVPLGANMQKFNPPGKAEIKSATRSALGFSNNEIVLIYAGTLNPARKIDVLIHAFALANKKNEALRLIIAGDDKDNTATPGQLKNLSNELGLSSKILFTGFLAYEALVECCLASDIGLCYIPQTPFYDHQPPTKLFEYMAAGLVVIATGTSANREIVADGVNGYICNDGKNELADCMQKAAIEFRSRSSDLTDKAHESIKNYSWDYIVSNHLYRYYKTYL